MVRVGFSSVWSIWKALRRLWPPGERSILGLFDVSFDRSKPFFNAHPLYWFLSFFLATFPLQKLFVCMCLQGYDNPGSFQGSILWYEFVVDFYYVIYYVLEFFLTSHIKFLEYSMLNTIYNTYENSKILSIHYFFYHKIINIKQFTFY